MDMTKLVVVDKTQLAQLRNSFEMALKMLDQIDPSHATKGPRTMGKSKKDTLLYYMAKLTEGRTVKELASATQFNHSFVSATISSNKDLFIVDKADKFNTYLIKPTLRSRYI